MDEKNNTGEVQPNYRKLKKLYSKIKKQMEFYFSDSNLVKDKFLNNLISRDPDGFVDLEVFKKFNKIKALTNSCEVIATSIARSDMFEVSEDHKKVRRITPIELSKDFDACTLYVEKLPNYADQKWVKDVFGRLGNVKYVNVPRYKASNKIKGFAFVEFESPEDVKNACEFYKISPEKECLSSEDENKNLKNVKKQKQEENVNSKKIKKSRTRSVSECSDKLTDFSPLKSNQQQEASDKGLDHTKDHSHQKGKRKRKRADSDSEIITKRSKEFDNEDLITSATRNNKEAKIVQSSVTSENSSVHSKEQSATDEENLSEVPNNHEKETKLEVSKNKRKRKNSKKHHSNTDKPMLRVMRKSEWKAYRNKYLELQRTTMSYLKKQIMLETQELKEQEGNVKPMDASETKKSLQFLPGVIIKVKLSDPVKNSTEIKNQVKTCTVVAYIDAPVESKEIFIRCHNSEDAQGIIKEEKLSQLGKAELLQGDEEKQYWEKIETDRKNKFGNPVPHKKRGREKLSAKAAKLEEMKNKHIYFDE